MTTKNYHIKQEILSKFTRTNAKLDIPRRFTVIEFESATTNTDFEDLVVELEWVDPAGEIQFTVVHVVDYEMQWAPILTALYDEVRNG